MKTVSLEICVGTSCYLLGAQDLIDAVECLPNDMKSRINLLGVTCLKNCGQGPNARINGQVLTNLNPDKLIDILDIALQQEEDLLCHK